MAPNNVLPFHGNEKTMNLNNMIISNIQSSPYFKNHLYELKTYHEVLDEIYYKVGHLEPWEKNSRKTAGQTGMCGGVRGVGSGGIVSSAFCLLYKLYTLKLSRKQLNSLINHTDSPYIRGLGFLFIRYTQPPADLFDWLEPYLDDEEEIDVKAGGGATMTIGAMVRTMLVKLDWWATLFPRIPVPIQKKLDSSLKERAQAKIAELEEAKAVQLEQERIEAAKNPPPQPVEEDQRTDRHGSRRNDQRSKSKDRERKRSRSRDRDREREKHRERSRERERERARDLQGRSRDFDSSRRDRELDSRSRDHKDVKSRDRDPRSHRDRSRDRKKPRDDDDHHRKSSKHKHHKRSRSRERKRSRSREKEVKRSRSRDRFGRETSFERDLRRERDRQYKK